MSKFRFGDIVRHKESREIYVVAGMDDSEGIVIVLPEYDARLYPIDISLLEADKLDGGDTCRLEWLFENGMSKMDKRIVLGDGVSFDNFRERIDAEIAKDSANKDYKI